MKHLSALLLLSLLLASCTKEVQQPNDGYLQNVQRFLERSLAGPDYMNLDFSRPVLSKVDSVGLYLLRIPFKNKALKNDFVLVKTDREGRVQRGKIVHLEGSSIAYGKGKVKKRRFDGRVTISSLDRKTVLTSAIYNGYIEAFHPNINDQRTTSLMPSGETLPEVVVVAYINNDYTYTYSDLCYLEKLLYNADGSGGDYSGSYYGSMEGGSDGGGGSSSSGDSDGGVTLDPPILIDYETDIYKGSIDLESYLKCFDNIPDAGATCSIEIFADIPVDSDPNKLFNWETESPGHTFLQIKKSNGSQSAIQNIGFYPNQHWKTLLTTAPIDGKFIDNGQHEFNASLRMNVSPDVFRSIVTEIRYLARFIQYDIDEYNCTDFALDVINKVRTDKITVPMYDIPGGTAAGGTRTPQGLYNQLKMWKATGHSESLHISILPYKAWVANSTGPCN